MQPLRHRTEATYVTANSSQPLQAISMFSSEPAAFSPVRAVARWRRTLLGICLMALGILASVGSITDALAAEPWGSAPAPVRFATLPPGSRLPTGDECAARITRSKWEPRPANTTANRAPGARVSFIGGVSGAMNLRFAPRVDGAFSGTTDEILRWGACKWGLDEDVVRAVAVQESWWRQSTLGDYVNGQPKSFGLMQVNSTWHPDAFPAALTSSAFNVDYALAWRRACYEGDFTWFHQVQPGAGYRPGDEWGCVGAWFSGRWYDGGATDYIRQVQTHLNRKTWKAADFEAPELDWNTPSIGTLSRRWPGPAFSTLSPPSHSRSTTFSAPHVPAGSLCPCQPDPTYGVPSGSNTGIRNFSATLPASALASSRESQLSAKGRLKLKPLA